MRVVEYIVEFFRQQGVDTIFGYQGGAITRLVDAIACDGHIKYVSNYHEQGAAFAAEGYARITGNIGIAIATSGPGATNLITGIASSFFDSIACLYITGQVNSQEYKKSAQVRQAGFQETDIVSIVKSITKYAQMIWQAESIGYCLQKAIYMAKEGRPGPVLLDIPIDVQNQEINPQELAKYDASKEQEAQGYIAKDIGEKVSNVILDIKSAHRPIILAGGGIRIGNAISELKELVEVTKIPVVATLMGLDSISHDIDEYIGFMGAYGVRYANLAVANADLILVLGARLDGRQVSTLPESFGRGARIIHVDIDKNELGRTIERSIQIHSDIKSFIKILIVALKKEKVKLDLSQWQQQINKYKLTYSLDKDEKSNFTPHQVIKVLSKFADEDTTICTDVGQNQIWVAQSLQLKEKQRLLTSGGMGAMGFAIPSAIGAFLGKKRGSIWAIVGDGGMQMNIQELQTIVREKLPIKIIILNNNALGMIRQFQEMYLGARYKGTIEGYSAPDFVAIGNAYGIQSMKITSEIELMNIEAYLKDDKAYIFDIQLEQTTYVYPKLGYKKPLEDQEPLLPRDELKKNMLIPIWESQEDSNEENKRSLR